jgi:hypothetical protein
VAPFGRELAPALLPFVGADGPVGPPLPLSGEKMKKAALPTEARLLLFIGDIFYDVLNPAIKDLA